MHGLTCDACGEALLADSDVRYIVDIRGYAAYDPLEITRDDLQADTEAALRRIIHEAEGMDGAELEAQVHKEFRLDLCPRCWRRYIEDPLQGLRQTPAGE